MIRSQELIERQAIDIIYGYYVLQDVFIKCNWTNSKLICVYSKNSGMMIGFIHISHFPLEKYKISNCWTADVYRIDNNSIWLFPYTETIQVAINEKI